VENSVDPKLLGDKGNSLW